MRLVTIQMGWCQRPTPGNSARLSVWPAPEDLQPAVRRNEKSNRESSLLQSLGAASGRPLHPPRVLGSVTVAANNVIDSSVVSRVLQKLSERAIDRTRLGSSLEPLMAGWRQP